MSGWMDLISLYRKYTLASLELKRASLAQWILESARGTSRLATEHLNFGGLKYRARMAGFADPIDYQGSDGELTTYCSFQSVEAFVRGYWHFIEAGPYNGYSTDPSYTESVISLFAEADALLVADRAALAATPSMATQATPRNPPLAKLAIIVGHNRIATGAPSVPPLGKSEFVFNGALADLMKANADHYNLQAEVFLREPNSSYSKEIAKVYDAARDWGAGCSIELHFNSADNPSASGSQILCRRDKLAPRALATSCLSSIVDLLKLKDRGISLVDRSDRGGGALYAIDSITSILVEPFFGSSQADCVRVAALGNEAIALSYLRGVRDWVVAGQLVA